MFGSTPFKEMLQRCEYGPAGSVNSYKTGQGRKGGILVFEHFIRIREEMKMQA